MKSKEEIIKDYEKIINYVIKNMRLGYRHDELFDVGMIGFVKGINSYDEKKGIKYFTYLYSCIKFQILTYIQYESSEKRTATIVSLNTMVSNDTELQDLLGYDINYEQNYYIDSMIDEINKRISDLTKKQQLIFNHLYGLNGYQEMTAKEIGNKYGFSRQSIEQIKKRTLNKLRFILSKYQNEERKYDKKD